ncbi:calycin-like domain-containing protein [Dysgonomonas sp. OttesenSCG-928-M03]|nr:calycin-like domain-containing protein [Dysgonomonas sp. OttesenSCG-928-M03]
MSKRVLYFMMLAFSLTVFAGCSDDDDDNDNGVIDYTLDIQGVYAGTLNVELPSAEPTETVLVLKRKNVNNVQVFLDKISIPTEIGGEVVMIDITEIEVKDIPVTKSDGTYTVTRAIGTIAAKVGGKLFPGIKGSVSGTVDGDKIDAVIDITVPAIMENPAMEIPIIFSGEKLNK